MEILLPLVKKMKEEKIIEQVKELMKSEWGKAFIYYLKEENVYSEDDFKYNKLNYEMKMFRSGFIAGKKNALKLIDEALK